MSAPNETDDAVWLARQITEEDDDYDAEEGYGADVEAGVEGEATGGEGEPIVAEEPDGAGRPQPVDLDEVESAREDDASAAPAQRFDHKVATGFAGLAVAAVVIALVAGVMFYSGGDDSASGSRDSVAEPAAVAVAEPAPTAAPEGPGVDRPLPYSADAAGSCPAGSTSAQTMTGSDPRNAFVCVRNGVDGQVIDIDLSKTYVITAISLTPGWVGKDASGASQWSQHRVVTTVQYMFNDTDKTLMTQETGNVHGEAVIPVKRVLASRVTMLIRQTSRPPAEPQPSATPAPGAGGLTEIFGHGAPTPAPAPGGVDPIFGQPVNTDPVDAKFAIGSLKIIGHEPI